MTDRTGKSAYIDLIDVCPGLQDKYAPIIYDKVREAGFKGVIIQCSLYSSTPNLGFDKHAEAASRAGLAVGAYHFAACDSDPIKQAEFFLRRMKNYGLRPGDIPPFMDLEYAKQTLATKGPSYVRHWGNQFMARMLQEMQHLHLKSVPGWYTYPNFGNDLSPIDGLLSQSPFWLARYKANKGPAAAWYPPDDWKVTLVPKGCPEPIMVQYSGNDGLPVPGVLGSCDRNIFRGSSADWAAFLGIDRPAHQTEHGVVEDEHERPGKS